MKLQAWVMATYLTRNISQQLRIALVRQILARVSLQAQRRTSIHRDSASAPLSRQQEERTTEAGRGSTVVLLVVSSFHVRSLCVAVWQLLMSPLQLTRHFDLQT